MLPEMELLILTAISIAVLHTVTGPDHYLPFIALSKARGWTVGKTIWWTLICGCGHVWSSVLLGLGGAAIGWSLSSIKWVESVRGGLAGWMLLGFGIVYFIWGLVKVGKSSRHKHFESYEDGDLYVYEHRHGESVAPKEKHRVTPWVLFLIFILGPCEPMIPLLYFPAAKASWAGMMILIFVYTFFTLAIMVAMVLAGYYGTGFLKTGKLEKYMHALSGATIFICGAGMVFMNW
jgi:hypothetical protein